MTLCCMRICRLCSLSSLVEAKAAGATYFNVRADGRMIVTGPGGGLTVTGDSELTGDLMVSFRLCRDSTLATIESSCIAPRLMV